MQSSKLRSSLRPFGWCVVLLVLGFVLSGCATYSGPQLTSVMMSTCSNQTNFRQFLSCTNIYWYDQVAAQGYSSDPNVLLFNNRMGLLSQGVDAGIISDADAIYSAKTFAFQLRENEQITIARENNALIQMLSTISATPPSSVTAPSLEGGMFKTCTYRVGNQLLPTTVGRVELCPVTSNFNGVTGFLVQ